MIPPRIGGPGGPPPVPPGGGGDGPGRAERLARLAEARGLGDLGLRPASGGLRPDAPQAPRSGDGSATLRETLGTGVGELQARRAARFDSALAQALGTLAGPAGRRVELGRDPGALLSPRATRAALHLDVPVAVPMATPAADPETALRAAFAALDGAEGWSPGPGATVSLTNAAPPEGERRATVLGRLVAAPGTTLAETVRVEGQSALRTALSGALDLGATLARR